MVMTESRFLTIDEVAARLRVAPLTIRRWLQGGRIHGAQIGGPRGHWRIPESELERIERGEEPRQ